MNIVQSLLACIIFASFNMLQNQPHTALEHLESGLNIMRGWIKKQESRNVDDPISPDDYIIRQYFVRLFTAYEFVVGNPTRDQSYEPVVRRFASSIRDHPSMHNESRPFDTLLEACSIFHKHLDIIYYRMRTAIAQGDASRITDTITWGQALLQDWHRKLIYYLNVIARTKSRTFNRASVFLRLQYNCTLIWLDTVAYKNEMLYDKHMPGFRTILELCANIVALDNHHQDGRPRVSLSFEYRVFSGISFVVQRCRDPKLRREARDIITGLRRHEGILEPGDANLIWSIIVWLEEHGLSRYPRSSADIPAVKRVCIIGLLYEPGSAASRTR